MTRSAPGGHGDAWYREVFGPDGVGTKEAEAAARRLARSGQIRPSAVDDVAQQIKFSCFLALDRYDPGRGDLGAFLGKVARGAAISVLRSGRAARRAGLHTERSLDDPITDRGRRRPETLVDGLADDSDLRRPGRSTAQEQSDRALDVRLVVAKLPRLHRQLCNGLRTGTREEVAAKLGIRPGTLDHHIEAIRRRFREAGLSEYVQTA